MHIDRILNKLKAKLVTRDFTQTFDINYKDIFVLTIKFNTLRVFLIIIILKDLKCY